MVSTGKASEQNEHQQEYQCFYNTAQYCSYDHDNRRTKKEG